MESPHGQNFKTNMHELLTKTIRIDMSENDLYDGLQQFLLYGVSVNQSGSLSSFSDTLYDPHSAHWWIAFAYK